MVSGEVRLGCQVLLYGAPHTVSLLGVSVVSGVASAYRTWLTSAVTTMIATYQKWVTTYCPF